MDELAACVRNLKAFHRYAAGHAPKPLLHDGPDFQATVSGFAAAPLNLVLGARLRPSDAEAGIDRAFALMRAAGVPFSWWVHPGDEPADLPERLEARGMEDMGEAPAMHLDLMRSLPRLDPTAPVEAVRDADDEADFLDVFLRGFEMPVSGVEPWSAAVRALPWRALPNQGFLARLDGRAAGAGSLFLHEGCAGLYNIATAPEARRRGLGRAITLHMLHEAKRAGATRAILYATAAGGPVYERLGFREVGRARIFTGSAGPHPSAGAASASPAGA